MTLHEAIEHVLVKKGQPTSPKDLAEAVNNLKLYSRRDGNPVPSSQIILRVKNYAHLFSYNNGQVSLIKDAKDNFKLLEDYLFKLLNTSGASGQITNIYFIVAFFLFFKRIIDSGEIYGIVIPEAVKKYFSTLSFEIEERFRDTYSTIFAARGMSEFGKLDPAFNELLNELNYQIRDVSEEMLLNIVDRMMAYNLDNSVVTKEEFSFFFNNLLRRFASIHYGFRENSSSVNINKLLAGFMESISGTVVDPFAGFAGTLIEVKKVSPDLKASGLEINRTVWALGYMNLLLVCNKLPEFRLQDSLRMGLMFQNKYDYVISDFPLSAKFDKREISSFDFLNISSTTDSTSIFIQFILSLLSQTGKAVFLVPASFLFTSFRSVKRLREVILKNDWLESVISLPAGVLQPYSGVSTAIVILNKKKAVDRIGKVLMINAENTPLSKNESLGDEFTDDFFEIYRDYKIPETGPWVSSVSIVNVTEPLNNDANYSPRRYTTQKNIELQIGSLFLDNIVGLSDVLTKIENKKRAYSAEKKVLYLSAKNLKNSTVDYLINSETLENKLPLNSSFFPLQQSALLIQTYFNDLKPSYYEYTDQPLYVANQIAAFSVDTAKVDIAYLVSQLHSDYLEKQIAGIRKGTVKPFFSIKDFLKLKIRLPNLNEQQLSKEKITEERLIVKEEEVRQLASQLIKSKENAIAEQLMIISSIQHDLGNKLPALKHTFADLTDFLIDYSREHSEFNQSLKIRPVLENEDPDSVDSLGVILVRINSILSYTISMVDDASGIISADPSKYKPTKQRLIKCIKEEIYTHYSGQKNIMFEIPENVDALVNLDVKQFSKALSNIIDNAKRHGFSDRKRKYHIAFELITGEFDEVLIIKNDGLPFPDGFSFEDYKKPYKFFGPTGNSGFGGYLINRIVENHNATIDIIRDIDPTDPYKVKIEIKFPKLGI